MPLRPAARTPCALRFRQSHAKKTGQFAGGVKSHIMTLARQKPLQDLLRNAGFSRNLVDAEAASFDSGF